MIRIRLVVVGETKDPVLKHLEQYYLKLLQKGEVQCDLVVLPVSGKFHGDDQQEKVRAEETQSIKKLLSHTTDTVIYLCEHGKTMTSVQFAHMVEQEGGISGKLTFILAGPYGLHTSELSSKIKHVLSLSPMTFTHEMVRSIFLEQLYRAGTILMKKPYHHQ